MLGMFLIGVIAWLAYVIWMKNAEIANLKKKMARSGAGQGGALANPEPTPPSSAGPSRLTADWELGESEPDGYDAWEGSFWEAKDPKSLRVSLAIDYVDGNQNFTQRVVDVQRFDTELHDGILIGYCRLRCETRTFRFYRIVSCVDQDTGEEIDDIAEFLTERYAQTPAFAKDRLLAGHVDVMRTLLYVGKADGALRAAERSILFDTCRAFAADPLLSDDMLDEAIYGMGTPSRHAFIMAVEQLAQRSEPERRLVLDAAERIVATQKTVHPDEQDALDILRESLAASSSA